MRGLANPTDSRLAARTQQQSSGGALSTQWMSLVSLPFSLAMQLLVTGEAETLLAIAAQHSGLGLFALFAVHIS